MKRAAKFNNKTIPDNIFSDHVIRSPTVETKVNIFDTNLKLITVSTLQLFQFRICPTCLIESRVYVDILSPPVET